MSNGNIVVTEERGTRVITLRRPGKKNAITQDMYREMSRAIDTAQNNPDIRCMIITGGSGVFTACIRWPSTSSRSSQPWMAPRSAWAP
jgi:enoyl-CoA hydratase/carnithine racemase